MKIINNINIQHIDEIRVGLKSAQKAYIAVAFLKESGLALLKADIETLLKRGGELKIIAGLNFGLTDANALRWLFELFKKYSNSCLYMHNTDTSNIFHPKLYLFENKLNCSVVCGSANMTSGGLLSNNETSIMINCKKTSQIWLEAQATFDIYIKNSNIASILDIDRHEAFQNSQNIARANSSATPQNNYELDFTLLNNHANQQLDDLQEIFTVRHQDYNRAKKLLNKIINANPLTKVAFKRDFLELIQGENKCWHSGSLARHKNRIIDNHLGFRDLIRLIKNNIHLSPKQLFHIAMDQARPLYGVGHNYVTEIMFTYNYNKFSILNDNPFTVLTQEAGYMFGHKTLSRFNGDDYEKFCEVCKEVQEHFQFNDLLEVDSFFNEIYWKIRNNPA